MLSLAVPAAEEDDLEQILAAEAKIMAELEAARIAPATATPVAAQTPIIEARDVIEQAVTRPATPAVAITSAAPSTVRLFLPPLPAAVASPSLGTDDVASALLDDSAEAAAEEEEAGFGHFAIPETEQEAEAVCIPAFCATGASSPAAAAVDPLLVAAAAHCMSVASTPTLVERRQAQLSVAQAQLHSLNAEIDLYARKMMQLQQLAAQHPHMQLAQDIARALEEDTDAGLM